jgi:muconolactone delta-isomerase
MSLTIEIPEDIAVELGTDATERIQQARELISLELYREGRISLRTMGRLAGVGSDYWSADAFRVLHNMPVSGYPQEEVDDLAAFSGK